MSPRSLRTIALALACPLILPAAGAQAATAKKKKVALPTISSVSPMQVGLGGTMTIRGKNFVAGKNRNTVVFKRDGGRAVFVKAHSATRTSITVKVPQSLSQFLGKKDGQAASTKFRLRILAKRFGRTFTSIEKSPTVTVPAAEKGETGTKTPETKTPEKGPVKAPGGGGGTSTVTPPVVVAPPAPPAPAPNVDCDNDGTPNSAESDGDNDLLADSEEATLGLDSCKADSDGDGMEDGFEFYSALSLNAVGAPPVPFPGKRPYPNPLDDDDAGSDYDGDGLSAGQEHELWMCGLPACPAGVPHTLPLSYNAGLKDTGGTLDDEDDADVDGLGNWVEYNGPMSGPGWWQAVLKEEPYQESYAGTDPINPDTDGDLIPGLGGYNDGDDDSDFDGYSNLQELSRAAFFMQPFNPCLPDYFSRTCTKHPPVDAPFEPFKTYGLNLPPSPIVWPKPPVPPVPPPAP